MNPNFLARPVLKVVPTTFKFVLFDEKKAFHKFVVVTLGYYYWLLGAKLLCYYWAATRAVVAE